MDVKLIDPGKLSEEEYVRFMLDTPHWRKDEYSGGGGIVWVCSCCDQDVKKPVAICPHCKSKMSEYGRDNT